MSSEKLSSINIEFGAPVDTTHEDESDLIDIITRICQRYKKDNPTRTMWVAATGSKPNWSQADSKFLGKPIDPNAAISGEPTFDDSILHIKCFERENYHYKERRRKQ